MKLFRYRGNRIRAADKDLVIKTAAVPVVSIFLLVLLFFHGKWFMQVEWSQVTVESFKKIHITPYFVISVVTALAVSMISLYLYCYFHYDKVKQLIHRQSLARMILQNGWYESEQIQKASFFKDVNSNRKKEKITYFPKMYYLMKDGEIRILVGITMGKYQEQLQNLEKKLEPGLYCELVEKELKEFFLEYRFLYDMVANRIRIEEVAARNGALLLMKNLWWEYDRLPHMLISGGTGSGKSYYILIIIKALAATNCVIYILDPKNADLADLATVMDNVYYRKEDMIACLDKFYEDMMTRSEKMKTMPGYKTGENYAYLGLPAHFLIFDEYVAFVEMLGSKEREDVLSKLKKIIMLGRQAGFFLVLACQRPDAKYLGDGIRDQFNFRVALGRMSELGYSMMFGETNKDFFLKQIKGRGYVDTGTSVISEFYTPLVPKGYDFLEEIGKIVKEKKQYEIIQKKEEEKEYDIRGN